MKGNIELSAVVLTRNCADLLPQCLRSLGFADEIVVIDDFSDDNTREIAEAAGARVLTRAMNGDFGEQRRFGIESARGRWILFIDSDEVVTEGLAKEICQAIASGMDHAYFLQRVNRFPNYEITHGSMRSDRVLRLFPKEGLEVVGRVHERVVSPYPSSVLRGRLLHYPYKDWSATIRKLDVYTENLAKQQMMLNKRTGFVSGVFLKPTWAFIKVYFFNKGFLDGRMGVMFAIHHAYYTFMKYAKYYLLINSHGKF